jgi:hypothetical protein
MTGYKVNIVETSIQNLSVKDKIKLKDLTNATRIDQCVGSVIKPVAYAILDVDNEHSADKNYRKYLIVDADGNKYHTGSESFWTSFKDIWDEMNEAGESDFDLLIYERESKNYTGKTFLTCSIA